MANSGKEFTHTAYAYRRTGKKHGRLLECGVGRIDEDGKAHVHLDRTPLNGFTGYVQLTPRGNGHRTIWKRRVCRRRAGRRAAGLPRLLPDTVQRIEAAQFR